MFSSRLFYSVVWNEGGVDTMLRIGTTWLPLFLGFDQILEPGII